MTKPLSNYCISRGKCLSSMSHTSILGRSQDARTQGGVRRLIVRPAQPCLLYTETAAVFVCSSYSSGTAACPIPEVITQLAVTFIGLFTDSFRYVCNKRVENY